MPKMKTKRAAAKRFRIKKSGKVKRKKANLRHILTTKAPKQKRQLRSATYVAHADLKGIRQSMPYG